MAINFVDVSLARKSKRVFFSRFAKRSCSKSKICAIGVICVTYSFQCFLCYLCDKSRLIPLHIAEFFVRIAKHIHDDPESGSNRIHSLRYTE